MQNLNKTISEIFYNVTHDLIILDGQTQGDGTSVGKCPNNLKCLSTGECRVCKIINDVHEGCSVGTCHCDESSDPPSCIGKQNQNKCGNLISTAPFALSFDLNEAPNPNSYLHRKS